MLEYSYVFDTQIQTYKTDKELAHKIQKLYKKKGCWTWYDDWEWANEESFIKDRNYTDRPEKIGVTVPLNFIKVKFQAASRPKGNRAMRLARRIFGLKV